MSWAQFPYRNVHKFLPGQGHLGVLLAYDLQFGDNRSVRRLLASGREINGMQVACIS